MDETVQYNPRMLQEWVEMTLTSVEDSELRLISFLRSQGCPIFVSDLDSTKRWGSFSQNGPSF